MRLNLAVRNTTRKMDNRILWTRVFQGFVAMLALHAHRATSDRQIWTCCRPQAGTSFWLAFHMHDKRCIKMP